MQICGRILYQAGRPFASRSRAASALRSASQCAHSTLYNVQQYVHHAHLQNWSIRTRPSFARAVQVDHDHGGPIGPWWSQAPAAQDVKVDSDMFGYPPN